MSRPQTGRRADYFGYTAPPDKRLEGDAGHVALVDPGASYRLFGTLPPEERPPPTPRELSPPTPQAQQRINVHPSLDRPMAKEVAEMDDLMAKLDTVFGGTSLTRRAERLVVEADIRKREKSAAEHSAWQTHVYERGITAITNKVDRHFVETRATERAARLSAIRQQGTRGWSPEKVAHDPLRYASPVTASGDPTKRGLARRIEERRLLQAASNGALDDGLVRSLPRSTLRATTNPPDWYFGWEQTKILSYPAGRIPENKPELRSRNVKTTIDDFSVPPEGRDFNGTRSVANDHEFPRPHHIVTGHRNKTETYDWTHMG